MADDYERIYRRLLQRSAEPRVPVPATASLRAAAQKRRNANTRSSAACVGPARSAMRVRSQGRPVQTKAWPSRLGVMFGDVVDSRAGHEASDRSVWTSVIVEVDEAMKREEAVAVRAIGPSVGPFVEQGLDEALGPYIVLDRVNETDGAVAGEPNAMATLRYAADRQVAWSRARSASDRRPRGGPSHPERVGPRLGRTRGDGSITRSASALRQWSATPSLFGNGHLMDICARSLIWVRWQSRSRLEQGALRPRTEVVG
jgi:hypothetical protein